MKKEIEKYIKAKNREKAKAQGFYDGRFRTRVVPDKKKKNSAKACRKNKGKNLKEEND